MFAFVIWDSKREELFCARDRFGIKPFYYYIDEQKFIFASEIKAILKLVHTPNVNIDSMDSYLTYGYTVGEETIYNGIKKIRPAHSFLLRKTNSYQIEAVRYWQLEYNTDYKISEDEWCYQIQKNLEESVDLHMISDVPLGAFLSGGIDSSSVVATMSKLSSRPIKTFSIGFEEDAFNELSYAKMVAEKYNTEHHVKIIKPQSIELLPVLVSAFDEPFADSSAIPTYYLSKFVREHVTVALSGDGGDELFGGYTHHLNALKLNRLNYSPKFIRNMLGSLSANRFLHGKITRSMFYVSKSPKTISAYFALFNQLERKQLYNADTLRQIKLSAESYKENIYLKTLTSNYLDSLLENDINTYLVDDILTKVDIMSMQNSLEVRVPFLDHIFVELVAKIPSTYKINKSRQKYILKKAMHKNLPEPIVSHRKQGFEVPLNIWFKNDLQDYVRSLLNPNTSKIYQYFDSNKLRAMVEEHFSSKRDRSAQLWSLLFLDTWLQQH
jgi:asparagine synthase (glutamine-hydrolysing)